MRQKGVQTGREFAKYLKQDTGVNSIMKQKQLNERSHKHSDSERSRLRFILAKELAGKVKALDISDIEHVAGMILDLGLSRKTVQILQLVRQLKPLIASIQDADDRKSMVLDIGRMI